MRRIVAVLVLALFATPAAAQKAPEFAAGQVWTLKDASPEARFFIVQVDETPRNIHGFAESPLVIDGRTSSLRSAPTMGSFRRTPRSGALHRHVGAHRRA